jgi:hypothetical protein
MSLEVCSVRVTIKQLLATAVAVLVTLAVLYAGQQIYNRTAIATPLSGALQAVPGVKTATVHNSPSLAVAIRLTSRGDLALVYPRAEAVIQSLTGRAVPLTVLDNHSPAEERTYESLRFVIAQGEATGQYVAMAQEVSSLAARHGEHATLVMDGQHLFLTLTDSARHRLFAVLPMTLGGAAHV